MGIVPATGKRGPRPSAKKSSGACARTLGCRTMSGKISDGGFVPFSPRKPKTATIAIMHSTKITKNPRSILVRSDVVGRFCETPSLAWRLGWRLTQTPYKVVKLSAVAYLVLVHDGDMLAAGLLQQLVHAVFRKPRVASFDCQEKAVIGHAAETLPVEHRMVPARQAIHDLPRKERRKCGEKHRELEHDWEKRGNCEKASGLTVNIEWIEKR